MLDCWRADPEERPSFKQLVTRIEEMMTRDTPYFDLNEDYESDASNTETKPENDQLLKWLVFKLKRSQEKDGCVVTRELAFVRWI